MIFRVLVLLPVAMISGWTGIVTQRSLKTCLDLSVSNDSNFECVYLNDWACPREAVAIYQTIDPKTK
jgi:hypothetical protein